MVENIERVSCLSAREKWDTGNYMTHQISAKLHPEL